MDYKIPSDELSGLRCSELEVPLFTSDLFALWIRIYMDVVPDDDEWEILNNLKMDSHRGLLMSGMCRHILDCATITILDTVAPQVQSWIDVHAELENAKNSSDTINAYDYLQGRTFNSVTEEDIQASIGNSLDYCFGAALGFRQKRTDDSTVGNIHIPVYKELCHQFGSAARLQADMVSKDGKFEEAVAKTLKAQLQKSSRKNISFMAKVKKTSCRKSRKVAPIIETNTSRRQKFPAIRRMFASAAKFLRNLFSQCISAGTD
ncbi:uncharacterized protein LOC115022043 [Cottoperca gobio]|uniref:Uncharacterized protein LOC115022043 n=1 Tax=Cottoperca gobio TaxID=56716 RepID=A0A6J2REW8_COTGO|nr:uncharacterized protein LOC115022043 [Cottoperca gobio]